MIYGDKVAMALFSAFETQVILIQNLIINNFYKTQFNFLWNNARPFKLKNK